MEEAWGKEGGGDLLMVEGEEEDSAAVFYHWRELPQVSFLSRQMFCRDKHAFVATKDVFCRNKHVFVVTFVAVKIILVAAPTNDNIYALHIDE